MGDFFNSSQFESNANNQQQGAAQADTPAKIDSHAHVSLSQVVHLTRKEDGLVIHRQKIHSITAIGMVVNVEEDTIKNVYLINDHTFGGPIEVQLWKNDTDETQSFVPPPPVMERTYIRVIGQARHSDNKPFIVAFSIEPIKNAMEIDTHMLEVIHDSLLLQTRLKHTLSTSKGHANSNISAADTSMFGQSTAASASSGGFNNIQDMVLKTMGKYGADSQYGLHRNDIKGHLPSVNGSAVDDAINFLVNEGHIFSTTDEDTFKSTDF